MKNEGFNPVRSSTKQGTGSRALDMYYVYKMAKFLVLPWTEWEAYRLGIIDDKGNLLKKKAQRTLSTEKENYTFFHSLMRKLKQNLEKVPGMKSKLGIALGAYWLFREEMEKHGTNVEALDEAFVNHCENVLPLQESMQIEALMLNKVIMENVK